MTIRVGVVDDSDIMRRGLITLLETDSGLEVVGQAGDGDEGIALVRTHSPDVLLLDVRMPRRDGLSIVKEVADLTRVLMLTFTDDDASIHKALGDGATGYLIHGTFDADSLGHMVRAAASGVAPFSDAVIRALQRGPGDADSTPERSGLGLSRRQVEVMDFIAQGRSNGDIAKHLFLAEKTVKNHINQLFAVLGVSSRAEAIVLWLGR